MNCLRFLSHITFEKMKWTFSLCNFVSMVTTHLNDEFLLLFFSFWRWPTLFYEEIVHGELFDVIYMYKMLDWAFSCSQKNLFPFIWCTLNAILYDWTQTGAMWQKRWKSSKKKEQDLRTFCDYRNLRKKNKVNVMIRCFNLQVSASTYV